ncbi:unnamed protein product [Urochloa humidicola]
MATSPRLLLLVTFLLATAPALSAAVRYYVGDRSRWAPNVNYTDWANRHEFHVADWLDFTYKKDMYDVVQVPNETAYNNCDSSSPIVSYSRGHNFVFQLNHTGRLYFICSRGFCFNGMKVSVLVQPAPLPPAMPPSSSHASRVRAAAGAWRWAALTAMVGAVLRPLLFQV